MTPVFWRDLALATVTDPPGAARQILDLNLERQILWLALALVVVLDSIVFGVTLAMRPVVEGLPPILASPAHYAVMVGGAVLISCFAIQRVGLLFGGKARFNDILALTVWMQYLSVAAQVALLALQLVIPMLAAMASLVISFYGFYIFLHFINQAHGLNSLFHAAGTLIAAVLAISLVLVVILALVGGPLPGGAPHV